MAQWNLRQIGGLPKRGWNIEVILHTYKEKAYHVLHPSPKAKVAPGIKSLPLYGQAQTSQHSPSGAGNTLAFSSQVGHVISLWKDSRNLE